MRQHGLRGDGRKTKLGEPWISPKGGGTTGGGEGWGHLHGAPSPPSRLEYWTTRTPRKTPTGSRSPTHRAVRPQEVRVMSLALLPTPIRAGRPGFAEAPWATRARAHRLAPRRAPESPNPLRRTVRPPCCRAHRCTARQTPPPGPWSTITGQEGERWGSKALSSRATSESWWGTS